MDVKDICDGCMVEFGDNGLGASVGPVVQRDGVDQVEVWPADNGAGLGPEKRWMPVAELRAADMDRWMYQVQTNSWVRKRPGVLIAEDQAGSS